MRVVLATYWLTEHPRAGGHFWVYAQYADALRRLGCDVWWLEQVSPGTDPAGARSSATVLADRVRALGLDDRLILYRWPARRRPGTRPADVPQRRRSSARSRCSAAATCC